MTEGRLTHRLMQASELCEGRPELLAVQQLIDAALKIVRRLHHRGP